MSEHGQPVVEQHLLRETAASVATIALASAPLEMPEPLLEMSWVPPLVRRALRARRPVPSKGVLARRAAGTFHRQ